MASFAAIAVPPVLISAGIRLVDDSSDSRRAAREPLSTAVAVSRNNDCGPACLYLICRLADQPQPLDALRRMTKSTAAGTSLLYLRDTARGLGFEAEAVRGDFTVLASRIASDDAFAILHVRSNHFVVAEGNSEDGTLRLLDPSRGASLISETDLRNADRWEGIMLCLTAPAE